MEIPKISENYVWNILSRIKKNSYRTRYVTLLGMERSLRDSNASNSRIWNLSLSTHSWPSSWKRANINPSPKETLPVEDSHFRGINSTPVTARAFEKSVYYTHVESILEKCLSTTQFAYRKGGNCTNALISIQHQVCKYLHKSDCKAVRLFAMDFI